MPDGDRLPDEIVLTLEETANVLLAIWAGTDELDRDHEAWRQLDEASRILVDKLLPDLRDL
jgi:hypothetical protein